MAKKRENNEKVIALNKRANFDYFIEKTYEAGIVLKGTEVKSLRVGKVTLTEAHAAEDNGEIFLFNLNIPEYTEANRFNHYPKRQKKLLLHKKEIKKLVGAITQEGMTMIPLKMYFNNKNIVKVLIGLAKGKKLHDKREAIKNRDWERTKNKMLKTQMKD